MNNNNNTFLLIHLLLSLLLHFIFDKEYHCLCYFFVEIISDTDFLFFLVILPLSLLQLNLSNIDLLFLLHNNLLQSLLLHIHIGFVYFENRVGQ